jgi:acetolactate synthase-1/2/3 large subunit
MARTLSSAGVRYAFGHPGGEVVELIDALETGGIPFLLTGHEATAAFMAGTAGRLTGLPGVCLATLGPGACNLVLGVASAFLDRDPLLAFSARTATGRIRRSNKQNLPLNDLFAPITKWSVALEGAATGETVRAALRVAASPPAGPVYLSMPADVATAPDRPASPPPAPPLLPSPDAAGLDAIIRALNAARRPVGVVGIALNAVRDAPAVRRFFEETGIPYTVTVQAKGVADEAGRRFLGAVAPAAGERRIIEWLRRSDCLLGVGFDPVESSQTWHFDAPLHLLANAPVGFGEYRPASACTGDVSALIDRVREGYRGTVVWEEAAFQDLRKRIDDAIRPAAVSGPQGLSPYHLIAVLRGLLPEETVVSSDVGAHKNVIGQVWRAPQPGAFLMSNGLSSMGYGPASAMAAALLFPDRPVVGITGDGAFGMMVQELETVRRLGIRPLFVVLCDASLAVIKVAQRLRGLPPRGVDFAPVDWAKVAEGFGVRGETARTMAEVERAVQGWLARRDAMVLAVAVDESLYTGLQY